MEGEFFGVSTRKGWISSLFKRIVCVGTGIHHHGRTKKQRKKERNKQTIHALDVIFCQCSSSPSKNIPPQTLSNLSRVFPWMSRLGTPRRTGFLRNQIGFLEELPATWHEKRSWKWLARWWFQRFFIFTPIWGKIPILTYIFQMGWNHQLARERKSPVKQTLSWEFFFDNGIMSTNNIHQ